MPELARFYGIIITIFFADHETPHIHAYYGGKGKDAEFGVSISIRDRRVLAGNMPSRNLQIVMAWMIIHEDELIDAWEDVRSGVKPSRIAPLK